jgi:hypothetical protein
MATNSFELGAEKLKWIVSGRKSRCMFSSWVVFDVKVYFLISVISTGGEFDFAVTKNSHPQTP